MELSEKFRFLKSPIISQYFSSLLGVGYDSKRESSLTRILIVSTIFLSIASGFTTYIGLTQYVPPIIALLMTIAIQGLLFTASWRIGATLSASKFKFSLLIIYFTTMLTSVFFSYSALLDKIYSPDSRIRDELDRARITSNNIINSLTTDLFEYTKTLNDSTINLITDWQNSFNFIVRTVFIKATEQANEKMSQYKKMQEFYNIELQKGGTPVSYKDIKGLSPPGRGNIAIGLEKEMVNYFYTEVDPIITNLARIDSLLKKHKSDVSCLLMSPDSLSMKNLTVVSETHNSLLNTLSDINYNNDSIQMPLGIYHLVSKIDDLRNYNNWKENNYKLFEIKTTEKVKSISLECLERMPFIKSKNKKIARNLINEIGKHEGVDVHHFELATGELFNFNFLAVGALLLAFAIDFLILFCGLMGARPDSFLTMRKPDDLFDIQEIALETILSLKLSHNGRINYKDPYIQRIVEILKRCKPDIELAYEGMPATLEKEDIVSLNMSKEIGVFLALELARALPDGRVGLMTRFILWMGEQVNNYGNKLETEANFKKSIE